MSSNETVEQIAKEMLEVAASHTAGDQVSDSLAEIPIDDYADRIREAHKREIAAKDEQYLKCREELAATRERRDECEVKMFKAFERVTKAEQKIAAKDAEIAMRLVQLSKENERLKAALKPVLDCELHIGDSLTEAVGEIGTSSKYGVCDEEGSDLWDEDIADNLNAVRGAQRIFKESEHEITAGLVKENELLKQEIATKDAEIAKLRECLKEAVDVICEDCEITDDFGNLKCKNCKWSKALKGVHNERIYQSYRNS